MINQDGSLTSHESGFEEFIKVAIPIGIGIFNCFLYSFAGLITRQAVNMGYPKVKFAIDLTGMAGVYYLLGFIYVQSFAELKFTLSMIGWMTLAGTFCFSAFMFQVFALMSGKGAIVQAVSNTQSVLQLILEIFIDRRVPNASEIISMCFCIAGAFNIAMAKK